METRRTNLASRLTTSLVIVSVLVVAVNAQTESDQGVVFKFEIEAGVPEWDTGILMDSGEAYLVVSDGFWFLTSDETSSSRLHRLSGILEARIAPDGSWFRISDQGTRDFWALDSGSLVIRIDPAVVGDYPPEGVGYGIVTVYRLSSLVTAAQDIPAANFSITNARPNPFNPRLSFSLEIDHADRVRLSILDVKGRRVAELGSHDLQSGHHAFNWDGRTASGAMTASGTYFVEAVGSGERSVAKVTMLK